MYDFLGFGVYWGIREILFCLGGGGIVYGLAFINLCRYGRIVDFLQERVNERAQEGYPSIPLPGSARISLFSVCAVFH